MWHDSQIKTRLLGGEPIAGEIEPTHGGTAVHCILRWSDAAGAQVDLVAPPQGWEVQLGKPTFVLHGVTSEGEEFTLLDAWVNQIRNGDQISRLHCSTVGLGALTEPDERWPRVTYSTANLSEWKPVTGLRHKGPSRRKPRHERVEFDAPEDEEIVLPKASLRLAINVETAWAYAPDWGIRTWLDLVVRPNRRFTLEDAHRDYAQPLLAFLHFASDRPDALTRELLFDPDSRRRVEIIRQGDRIESRDWRPGRQNGYLFQRHDLPDLQRAIRRWWKLHREVRPALGLFADHVSAGNVYSPSRLLTLYTALEKYSKTRFGAKGEFKDLRRYGGVSSELTGCGNDALKLLGASRGYFAHADLKGDKFTVDQIEEGTLASTRRASALMQACLLREIGLRKDERIERLERHYARWPIP